MYKYHTKTYGLDKGVLVCLSTGCITANRPIMSTDAQFNATRENLHLAGGLYTVVTGPEGTRIIFPDNL